MQTFLPYPSFYDSAQCLDRQRLGKQRVETLQLLRALAGETTGWRHHPATRMWRGYENALVGYGLAMCDEWIRRGYHDTCRDRIARYSDYLRDFVLPPWFGHADFHRAHRSNLLRKDPLFYGEQFETDLPNDLPYVWPEGVPV